MYDLTRAIEEIADGANREWRIGAPICSKWRRPRWLAGSPPPRVLRPWTTDNAPAWVVSSAAGSPVLRARGSWRRARTCTLCSIDSNDYHQFQPLLYQVVTSMFPARTTTYPLREIAADSEAFDGKPEVVAIDPLAGTVTTIMGETFAGDDIILAAGSSRTSWDAGRRASFRSTRSTTRTACATGSSRHPRKRIVIRISSTKEPSISSSSVGPLTGVEVAGVLSETINTTLVHDFPSLAPRAKLRLIIHGTARYDVADKGHAYAARIFDKDGVELFLGLGVKAIGPGHVTSSDASTIRPAAPSGRRLEGRADRRHCGTSAGPRWPHRCPTRFHGRGLPGRPGHRRHREHPG